MSETKSLVTDVKPAEQEANVARTPADMRAGPDLAPTPPAFQPPAYAQGAHGTARASGAPLSATATSTENASMVRAKGEPLLLSIKQLSEMLGRSQSSLWEDDKAGRIPMPIKIGRSVRWRRLEIEAWVEAGCPNRSRWSWQPSKTPRVPHLRPPRTL